MPQSPEQLQADLAWAVRHFTSSRYTERYPLYRAYYDGKQNLAFATPKFDATFGKLFSEFAYNRCGSVVDAVADRLKLTGFSVSTDTGEVDDTAQSTVDLYWRINRLDRLQGDLTTEALRTGDAYAIVWPEPHPSYGIVPRIYINNADVIAIRYDDDTKTKMVAVKAWREGKFWRFNFYYSDLIYKFVALEPKDELPKDFSSLRLWEPRPQAVADGLETLEPNPLPNPFGVIPVFHAANNARDGDWGRSELANVLPLQDALNKACTDLMVAMEYGAFPQRWAVGLQVGLPDPATGKVRNPFREGPGQVWTGNQGAQFGSFPTTDLAQFTAVQSSLDTYIANVARIPSHWLQMSGNFPSGESLKTAEAPFVAKLADRQVELGQFWEDVFGFAMLTSGYSLLNLQPIWQSPELRSEQDMLDAALKKSALGWSTHQIQRELGLDQSVIDLMEQERLDSMRDSQMQMLAGLGTGVPSGGGNTPPDLGTL